MGNPKISVVMSVYNGSSNVSSTIESVLNQTYENFEFIIVNDNSNDNTQEILNNYQCYRKNIRIIINEENLGLTKSLIKGIKHSRGEYIARIDSGDLMHAERLQKQIEIIEKKENYSYGIISSNCKTKHIFDGKTETSYSDTPRDIRKIKKKMIFKNCIGHVSVMFRKDVYESVGGYNPSLSTSQDYDLWMRMLKITDIYVIKDYLTTIIYDDSIPSISLHKNKLQRRNGIAIIKNAIKEGLIPVHLGLISLVFKIIMLYTPRTLLNYIRNKKRTLLQTKKIYKEKF